ncbi:hypothetical protein GDO78_021327 [Eleutherodactylus coqui]|uniref:LYR motif-containing protein 2 n=1 Tax=Eleutherodactylus coqui TaxID=57060 RepID=A0A8J6BHH5_ELECQ|nr:hypothetical protein GDO78_021327 [Eleutherodactylus coqui]
MCRIMSSRLPPGALTLRQFLVRQRVLGLYRRILRAVRQIPEPADRTYMRDWAREEFRRNKATSDEVRRVRRGAPYWCDGVMTSSLRRSLYR